MLTVEDLALLAREACLVDGEAVARAHYAEVTPALGERHLWDNQHPSFRAAAIRHAEITLRAAGLEPGRPAMHLILAAIERRGWRPAIDPYEDGFAAAVITVRPETWMRDWRSGDDPAAALALAFVAAVRASEEHAGEA